MDQASYKQTIAFLLNNCPHVPLLAYGHTGVGKSEIPIQVATEQGVPIIYLDCTGMEPTDLLGMPSIGAESLYTHYKPPEFFKLVQEHERGIIILDEVTRLDLQVRHTVMQLLARREIGTVKLQKGWLVVMTANPTDAGYQVAELDKAFVRRSIVVPVSGNIAIWQEWASGAGVNARIIGMVQRVSGNLYAEIKKEIVQHATFAGLKAAGELLDAGLQEKLPPDTALAILTGIVGKEAAQTIMQGINAKKLQELLNKALAGEELGFREGSQYDVQIALVIEFCRYIKDSKHQIKKFANQIKKLYDQVSPDIKIVLIRNCHFDMVQNPKEFESLINEWAEWCARQVDNIASAKKHGAKDKEA